MNLVNQLEKILENDNVFLSGGAGVGKSYLTNELKLAYKKAGKNVISLGSTAISAFNVGGVTLHSFFALALCANLHELVLLDKKQKDKIQKLRKVLKSLDLLIIDEISMVSAEIFDLIAYRLRHSDFAGKVLVVGDFFQLPPVLKQEQKAQNSLFKGYYAFSSLSWADFKFKNVLLNVAKRTSNKRFYEYLSLMRKGAVSDEILAYFEKMCIKAGELNAISDEFTLLCGINKKADLINEQKLATIDGDLLVFKALRDKIDENLDDKAFEKWIKSLSVLDELRLKVGAKVIFCVNNYEAGYYNGEQGEITAVENEDGKAFIKITKSNGVQIKLARYTFLLEDFSEENELLASFSQFPIKLAYAITIHKSQGMSIERLVCDIDNIFENGQLYVALSRAVEPKNLRIFYSRAGRFRSYFAGALKFDKSVLEFYAQSEFVNLKEKDTK